MTKDSGQQVSYGVPYESIPTVTPAKSQKPTSKTAKRVEDQTQLRMDIKKYNPCEWYQIWVNTYINSFQRFNA